MAGYSFRLSENVSDGHLCSFKIGYFKCVFFGLSLLVSSTFLKKGVDWGKQSNQCDRETPDSTRNIYFFCWRANLFLTLLPHPHVLHNCLKVAAPAVGEEQANACVGESAKMSWWSSSTGLRCCIWNWPPVSLDVSRKRHSSQVIVPEDLPTIPPCKRFARLLVTMMLRMCSKIFFPYNSNCFHICPKSTFVKHLCDSGLRLLQRNWSC